MILKDFILLFYFGFLVLSYSFVPQPLKLFSSKLYIEKQHDYSNPIVNFAGVSFDKPLSTALVKLGIARKPSPIQTTSLLPICEGMSCILHAETGSGKTFAYLLPALKKLYSNPVHLLSPCKILIIVPSRELVHQVAQEINLLTMNTSSHLIYLCNQSKNLSSEMINQALSSPIWIGPPYKLHHLLEQNYTELNLCLKNLDYLVLDEVDRLISIDNYHKQLQRDQFRKTQQIVIERSIPPVQDFLNRLYRMKAIGRNIVASQFKLTDEVQVIAASATIGRDLRLELSKYVSGSKFFQARNVNSYDNTEEPNEEHSQLIKLFPVIRPPHCDHITLKGQESQNESRQESSAKLSRYISLPPSITNVLCITEKNFTNYQGKQYHYHHSQKEIDRRVKYLLTNPYLPMNQKSKSPFQRCLIFVPFMAHVPDTIRMMRRFGYPQTFTLPGSITGNSQYDFNTQNQSYSSNTVFFVMPSTGIRGLHIPSVDCVLLTHPPKTMDEYVHMAGRTSRLDLFQRVNNQVTKKGNVVTLVKPNEARRMMTWQTPLNINFTSLVYKE